MRMVQAAVDQVVRMIPVRDGFMTAARAVRVAGPARVGGGLATIGILLGHPDGMLVHVVAMGVVQVAVVQVVDVAFMTNGGMAAARTVLMRMIVVFGFVASRHVRSSLVARRLQAYERMPLKQCMRLRGPGQEVAYACCPVGDAAGYAEHH